MAKPQNLTQQEIAFNAGCSPVCDVVRKPKRRKRKSRPWHRVLGMVSALPLIWVLITGVLLNHQEDLGLVDTEVTSPLVLSAYGMMPSGEPQSAEVGTQRLTQWDGLLFLGSSVVELEGEFLGAVSTSKGFVVASEQSVTLYDSQGEVVEKLDELCLPELPLLGVAQQGERVFLQNTLGWHTPDEDWLEFTAVPQVKAQSIAFSELEDAELKQQLAVSWAGGGLPLSRIVLDLHAGHFLGDFAKYFYDVVAVCTLWLIGTGLVLQYRTSRRSKPVR